MAWVADKRDAKSYPGHKVSFALQHHCMKVCRGSEGSSIYFSTIIHFGAQGTRTFDVLRAHAKTSAVGGGE